MGPRPPCALRPLFGVLLLWPYVLTRSVSSKLNTEAFLPAGQGEQHPHVAKRSTQNCDTSFDNYCLNHGQCMFLVDVNENHCRCELGFHGNRCEQPQLVFQPMGEEQLAVTVVCVTLLIIGLAGILYFCCKWYKKSRFPRQQKNQGYKGVQSV